jgi:hypothetical protein
VRREREAGGRAIEDANAEGRFERRDAPAHGRLVDAQALGRVGEGARAADGEHVAQIVPIDHALHPLTGGLRFVACPIGALARRSSGRR